MFIVNINFFSLYSCQNEFIKYKLIYVNPMLKVFLILLIAFKVKYKLLMNTY